MTFVIPPAHNHRELTPEEVNEARVVVMRYLKDNGVDLGVTTAIVLTVYDSEVTDEKHLEMRGTTNPKLKRFSVPLRFRDGAVEIEADYFRLRPAYDPRRARGRARKK